MGTRKRAVAAVAAIALTLLGVVCLMAYANGAKTRAFDGAELVSVLQVDQPVPAGTKSEDLGDAVRLVKLPKTAVPTTALKTVDGVSGLVATARLVPGEVLVTERFGTKAEVNGGSKIEVPKGYQEMLLQLKPTEGLEGKVAEGDKVGVIVSYDDEKRSGYAMNGVLVLGAQRSSSSAGDQAGEDTVLWLAVTGKQAVMLAHAQNYGKVYLTRQGKDAKVETIGVAQGDVLK